MSGGGQTREKNLPSLSGARILVVEDEYFIAQDLRGALEAAGAQVIGPAGDAASALALLAGGEPAAAIVDINLHGVVSFAVAAELSRRGVPFVFATGYEPVTVPATYQHVPHWRKPFATADLVEALGSLIAKGTER